MSDKFDSDSAPRERSTYSAFGDEYKGFDARDDESGGKGPLVMALAAGVVLVFGTVVWNAYRQGTKEGPGDTPIFAADSTPFKHRPDSAKADAETPSQPRLFEEDAESEVIKASVIEPAQLPDGKPRDIRPSGSSSNSSTQTAEVAPQSPPTPAPAPVPTPTPTPTPTQQAAIVPPPVVSTPRPLPPPVTTTSTSKFDPSGQFLVQIMALRDLGATEQAWNQLAEAHADIFQGAQMDIQRADLGAKGIFYRLRASAFSSRSDADDFCSELKARGESCIVIAES
ncbi:MAG: hypothetical protein CMK07_04745 [Ponticaulis sp.]|nr:hypothetical protein [Ponticaulis sp.]